MKFTCFKIKIKNHFLQSSYKICGIVTVHDHVKKALASSCPIPVILDIFIKTTLNLDCNTGFNFFCFNKLKGRIELCSFLFFVGPIILLKTKD